jgi:hypothetical protein
MSNKHQHCSMHYILVPSTDCKDATTFVSIGCVLMVGWVFAPWGHKNGAHAQDQGLRIRVVQRGSGIFTTSARLPATCGLFHCAAADH